MSEQNSPQDNIVDKAVAQGGAYELIHKRLENQSDSLKEHVVSLNEERLEEFGTTDMAVSARVRVRTENNCIARDIVQVGEHLLFGYNVFIGLKKETQIEDVFALYSLSNNDHGYEISRVNQSNTFLEDTGFVNDFHELYRYYKNARLLQLTIRHGKLLAGFQIGEKLEDIRVFRWSISADGKEVQYIDNRGERDIELPPSYDFEWVHTNREDSVNGRHPHINILDSVFVETINGDLTIKVEDNTEDGHGIYRELVEDKTQSLDDAEILYARLGQLILLKIKPYQEEEWRYLVFNMSNQEVIRIDAIGESCVQLPEDHGIIFPGGYYLQSGEYKQFEERQEKLRFKRVIHSPNGEDVLYIFYAKDAGFVGLFAYNLITKSLQNPVFGHGYALSEDGTLIIFSAEKEPTRVHPMQVWTTPYMSREFASTLPASNSFLGKVGNAELVRGISDLFSICRQIKQQHVSIEVYTELQSSARKIFDAHYWVESETTEDIASILRQISHTSELALDEFEKVESIRQQSTKAMQQTQLQFKEMNNVISTQSWQSAEDYVHVLENIQKLRGHLATIKKLRYIDVESIMAMETSLLQSYADVSEKTGEFLAQDGALLPYEKKVEDINSDLEKAQSVIELEPVIEEIDTSTSGLDLLSQLMVSLKLPDANLSTLIIEKISQIYALLNQSKARARIKRQDIGGKESIAKFAAQFALFTQSINNALDLAKTPDQCDEQLSRLLIQLEELESQYGDLEQFLDDIMQKREELYDIFESHKQDLLDKRQRKALSYADAAERILHTIEKRSHGFSDESALNTYFAADTLIHKIAELVEKLNHLEARVKADDIEARFKAIKDQAIGSQRDKNDIYEEGGKVIKLGPTHKFGVNTQDLDLTIIAREDSQYLHITSTEYFEKIEHAEMRNLQPYWDEALASESPEVYRAEYLAFSVYQKIMHDASLHQQIVELAADKKQTHDMVLDFARSKYADGYQKGIHDHDAAAILTALIQNTEQAGLLRFSPLIRGQAQVFWAKVQGYNSPAQQDVAPFNSWIDRARSAVQMHSYFHSKVALEQLQNEIVDQLDIFVQTHPLPLNSLQKQQLAEYLVLELGAERIEFVTSHYANNLVEEFKRSLNEPTLRQFKQSLDRLKGQVAARWQMTCAWLEAMVQSQQLSELAHYTPEAAALINIEEFLTRKNSSVDVHIKVTGLLGEHRLISQQQISFDLDNYFERMHTHQQEFIPGFIAYQKLRHNLIGDFKESFRLEEFKARPLSSFVRNRLINEAYLPVIGDNLAKQIGALGAKKRSDLMGLLMMISPPGYGKTTLMEYVANRLGLIFMKINCPSLGHDVKSLDPQRAPDMTSAQELEKLNLALEMGNNVMLYLDDIQHTNPEFLQKFISLCDGSRRIEGVWKEKPKTYDLRGRKFCVVMAGNPYTESGELFKIPDMLANRADIYNLGDILGDMGKQFALSYVENCLTSNAVLAPLATRPMNDFYKIIEMAEGSKIASTELSYDYSAAELKEIIDVLQKLFVIRDVILSINQQYISSAAQNDDYRQEPAFKLQGSYRNMNKMAEKISAIMNEKELQQLISDHYQGESQLLTTHAESNLLKLGELRGVNSPQQQQRWDAIKKEFIKQKGIGGSDSDTGTRVVAQLSNLSEALKHLGTVAESHIQAESQELTDRETLKFLVRSLKKIGNSVNDK